MSFLTNAEAIAELLRERITAILVANGCETDVGATVFRGRRDIDDESPPCTSILEGEDVIVDTPGRKVPEVALEQRYIFVAYLPCDPDNPNTAAHAAIRDLKRAIFQGDSTLGGKVRKVSYRGRNIGPRRDGVKIVMAVVEIDVEYVETLSNP